MSSPNQPDPAGDPFAPPKDVTEVFCLHCGQEYESWQIQWREDSSYSSGGHWCCPTPECDGHGFGFDILPTDRAWQDENGNGWHSDEDYDFDGTVDGVVIDQFWRELAGALHPAGAPDGLAVMLDVEDNPLQRLLTPEEWLEKTLVDDIPF